MTKDISEIKKELSLLKRRENRSFYNFCIGQFYINIFTFRIQEHPILDAQDNIMNHEMVDVYLYEPYRSDDPHFIEYSEVFLEKDSRFKDYAPIKYSEWAGYSTGVEMPISHLCELINYLHRLDKLSTFG